MSRRSSIRFMQKEQMKTAGLEKICKPRYDSVNECYRSTFAMHWKDFPDMSNVPLIKKHRTKHTKRNLRKAVAV